jgi:predicted nucleic acid-binding protein
LATRGRQRRFLETLSTCQRVNLDTNVLIYHLGGDSRYTDLVTPLFQRALEGSLELVLSAIAFMEALVDPIRSSNLDLMERLVNMASGHPNLSVEEVSLPIIVQAAVIRAASLEFTKKRGEGKGLAVPDCIVLATGIVTECDATVTNDKRGWRRTLERLAMRPPMARGPQLLKLPPTLYLDEYVQD